MTSDGGYVLPHAASTPDNLRCMTIGIILGTSVELRVCTRERRTTAVDTVRVVINPEFC